jgi:hypothetical protein
VLEGGIMLLYATTALFSVVAATLAFYATEPELEPFYCYVVDGDWQKTPSRLAQSYLVLLRKIFGPNLFGVRASLNACALSIIVTFTIMLMWRALETGSLVVAVEDLTGPTLGLATVCWGLSTAAAAPFSLKITALLMERSASSERPSSVFGYTLLDALAAYVLIGISVYFCIVFTLPIITWHDQGGAKAIEMAQIFFSYAHGPALVWPTNSGVAVSGLPAVLVSVATALPTLIFLALASVTLVAIATFSVVSWVLVQHLSFISRIRAARLSKVATLFWYAGGSIAAVAFLVGLVADA